MTRDKNFMILKLKQEAIKMASWGKWSRHKHEGLSTDSLESLHKPGMMARTCDLSTGEAEAGRS